MVTMLLGGLWHGANWTFVVWGGLQGAGLSAERKFLKEGAATSVAWKWIRRIVIFHFVCLSWRANHCPAASAGRQNRV